MSSQNFIEISVNINTRKSFNHLYSISNLNTGKLSRIEKIELFLLCLKINIFFLIFIWMTQRLCLSLLTFTIVSYKEKQQNCVANSHLSVLLKFYLILKLIIWISNWRLHNK